MHSLKWKCKKPITWSWNDRGSDERQYCAPGINLPIASIMRTKYGTYPEYHTSLDKIGTTVTAKGLMESFSFLQNIVDAIEINCTPITNTIGEPCLSKYNLRNTLGAARFLDAESQILSDILTYADGTCDLLEISEKINKPIWNLKKAKNILLQKNLISLN